MNEKNIDNLFRNTKIGDLFYIKEISTAKLFNIYTSTFQDTILPFKFLVGIVIDINEDTITLFSSEKEILKFSKEELNDYNVLEKFS